jgi:hypothetical protein
VAVEKKEEITPVLIEILEDVYQNPEKYTTGWKHIYACVLLGYFCETDAHDAIVKLTTLSDECLNNVFSDIFIELFPTILLQTCGGDVTKIQEIALNNNTNEYCRSGALSALSYALIEGYITRKNLISFYKELLLNPPTSFQETNLYSSLAVYICNIYPEELIDEIKKRYDNNYINPFYISYTEFIKTLDNGKEACLKKLKEQHESNKLTDIDAYMSWWKCFKTSPVIKNSAPSTKTKAEKNKQKAKRKAAKASRKKNKKRKK